MPPDPAKPAFVTFMCTAHVTLQRGPQIHAVRIYEIPNTYQKFKDVFSDTLSQAVPKDSPRDHIIDTQDARVLYSPISSFSERQLQVLWEYLKENLERS